MAVAVGLPMATPTPQMKTVLDQLGAYKAPPIPTLSAEQARSLPTPATAAMEVAVKQGKPAMDVTVKVTHALVPGPAGKLVARIYRPEGSGNQKLPIAVYFHGGGWVIANLDTYDASCRALSKMANCMVVSIAYRQGPEHKFPAAHEDAYASTQWIMKNGAAWNGDTSRVAVVGESAGGNMASAVCLMAKDRHGRMPKGQILVYPLTQVGMTTPSYVENMHAKPLDVPMLKWFGAKYLPNAAAGKNKYFNLLSNPTTKLKGLPPATIILAQIDPLRSEGEMYGNKLRNAGVRVNMKTFNGVTHEFFGMGAVVDEAMQAEEMAADGLKMAFR